MALMIWYVIITMLPEALIRNISCEHLVKLVGRDESIVIVYVLLGVDISDEKPPKACNDICDHEHNDNESENFVGVHDHVLGLDSIRSR